MNSFWGFETEVRRKKFPPLSGDIKTDVLVVGGGVAGILCAYMLKKKGVRAILIEAREILSGTSGNTTAKISFQHGLIYDKLIRSFGEERARIFLEGSKKACRTYEELAKTIPCDYEKKDSFVYSRKDRRKIEREIRAYQRLGEAAEFSVAERLPFPVLGAVCIPGQAEFNPLKFFLSIACELEIYENTKLIELMPRRAKTNRGTVSYDKIVIATHFPILNKHGAFFMKLYQHRSYVLALRGAEDLFGMYIDEDERGLSFRNYRDLLLLGGGAHRTGKRGGSFSELERFARETYPKAETVFRFSAQDCMSLDSLPYVGRYSGGISDTFVISGFNKWGMSSSMLAAELISDMMIGKKNESEAILSPSRSILHPALFENLIESAVGILTPTRPRCPHLGCALSYNAAEHSWDCPCHGSRFSESGELIDNPATDDNRDAFFTKDRK